MKHLRKYFDSHSDNAMAFQICTIVTLRQTLTHLTMNVHSSSQTRDVDKKRKRTEKIAVNAVMNKIEASVNSISNESTIRSHESVYQELLTELLNSVIGTKQRV